MTDEQLNDRLANERIVEAAIRQDGEIYTGRTHSDCFKTMNFIKVGHEQGFITSRKRFADRIQAAKIALAAGQINDAEKLQRRGYLISEDL